METFLKTKVGFIFCAWICSSLSFKLGIDEYDQEGLRKGEDMCAKIICRAGRECKSDSLGIPACVCVQDCSDHFNPACGSDGRSYDNHCLLHREACISGTHIRIQSDGYCPEQLKLGKRYRKKYEMKRKHKIMSVKTSKEPIVCFQSERDQLLKQIAVYFDEHSSATHFTKHGVSHNDKVWSHFSECDGGQDGFVDSTEFIRCIRWIPTTVRSTSLNSNLIKALCVDAIVDAGDTNSDWRLDFEEFKTLVDPDFIPKNKMCSLEGKQYEDGAETDVDCNDCVCACGSWVCTSRSCDKSKENEIDDSSDPDDDYSDEEIEELLGDEPFDDDYFDSDEDILGPEDWKKLLKKLGNKI
ncbi:follistatin-related protein 1-like isoform X2 [Artemia franciscana]|uniref:follistatin-related protein 1-like isoform X2 n=1 Tax=Artemia franciscana TaxID=6661 RepID=UPI0032DBA855